MEQVIQGGAARWKHGLVLLRRGSAILPWLAIGLALMQPLRLQAAAEPLEYQVKAVFLLNFTKFIEWPPAAFEEPDSPIAICILGEDPFGGSLNQIVAGEVVSGRRVAVQRIKSAPPAKSCQLLFVSRSEKEIPKLLPELRQGVLTVGEGEDFVREGGMIGFVIENRRVRFAINRTMAENAGLILSSKLLSVAKSVE
jgi:hypothetical protein